MALSTNRKGPNPIIVVGVCLDSLVTTYELTRRKIPVVDQENAKNLDGQAFWSLGGLFCVNLADQRSKGIKVAASWR